MARMGKPGSYDDRRSLFAGRWEETRWLSERFRNDRGSDYVRSLVPYPVPEVHAAVVKVARRSPWLFAILAERFRVSGGVDELERLLRGEFYDVARQLIVPEQQIIATVRPQIILANERLMEHLKRQPETVFDLSPRKFEELIADLLVDFGYDVERRRRVMAARTFWPAWRRLTEDCCVWTRRSDIALTERSAWNWSEDCSEHSRTGASSGMLVTTSSFSPDAHAFQKRHQYKLALRDYGNVVRWIAAYKKKQ